PRQWGACWLACHLYEQLALDQFWKDRLPDSREGTCWQHIVQTLVCYRLIDPGSEWRLHRLWFDRSAMGDLLGEDYSLVEKNALYRCLDKVLEHKQALFSHLTERWQDLFGAKFDVLHYDLTSTYFESSQPSDEKEKRRYGYSRDKRPDCLQVVIALIVTPEGFPLAYEVLPGNTSDKTTLKEFLHKIETQYGKAERIWVMDRGIPTEEVLSAAQRICSVVDTPVIVDADTGYGNAVNVIRTVQDLIRAGAAGMFLEDQVWPKRCGHMTGKQVIPLDEQLKKLRAAIEAKGEHDFYIVARTRNAPERSARLLSGRNAQREAQP